MDHAQLEQDARHLRFPVALERQFQRTYFDNSLAICRIAMAMTLLLWMAFGVLDYFVLPVTRPQVWFVRFFVITPILLGVLALSFTGYFRRLMQGGLFVMVLGGGFGLILISATAQPNEPGYSFYYAGLMLIPLISYSFARMRFWNATIANWIVVLVYVMSAVFSQGILQIPQGKTTFLNSIFFILAANLAGMGACYSLELYARQTFLANYFLAQERDEQRRERERTESNLTVLSQAIGVIVHDLGTPLTSVQLGADTLEMFLEKGKGDKETFHRITGFIKNGAQLLNYLRLSLMEQLRVLEGEPVPIEAQPTSLREIVEAGLRYQKPRFSSGREVAVAASDIEINGDKMKLITVFMNLIGNALKYSDGKLNIFWRADADKVFVAIADEGKAGRGITRRQAAQLFVAFGRLDTHKSIEGTGFGLLSAQKIIEAHGGQLWIEGTADGTPESAPFASIDNPPAHMLEGEFRTAFVMSLPM